VPLPLSISIVCKNNERTIARTLDSVAPIAAEILAADSGSTDSTLSLLARHHARVIHTPWLGHVRTKQLALDACTQPWALCLDSDEALDDALRASITALINAAASNPAAAPHAATLNRTVYYRDTPLRHAWQPEHRLRLARRQDLTNPASPYLARWSGLDPHDALIPTAPRAPIAHLHGTLRHDSFLTFADQLAKDSRYAALMAANLHAAGRTTSPLRCLTSPLGALLKQLVLKSAWRDGVPGLLAALSTASATLQKHTILLELSQTTPPPSPTPSPTPTPPDAPSPGGGGAPTGRRG
jgi:glycosyltransferase involved in cell wall biosynthesis